MCPVHRFAALFNCVAAALEDVEYSLRTGTSVARGQDLILLTKVLVQGRCRDRRPPRCSCGTVRRPEESPGRQLPAIRSTATKQRKHVVPTAASPIAPLIITTCTRAHLEREA
ncbi:hypothetical protein quinque_014253 [Culex quinquefasciatus]